MLRICYVNIDEKKNVATFTFPDINYSMLVHILRYKSWQFTTWNNNEMIDYLEVVKNSGNETVIKSKYGVGFVPVIVKHLVGLGFVLYNTNNKYFDVFENCLSVNYPLLKYQLRNYQYDCVLKWQRDHLGIIKSPTGSGKTVMGCYVIGKTKYKTLILVHTIDLVNVWKDSLIRGFGASFENRIGIFGGGSQIDEALNTYNNVVIGTYQSALNENNIKKLIANNFGLVIADEAHHVAADTFKGVLNRLMIPCKLGLSATPRRLDGREGDIYALVDNVKSDIDINLLIKEGHIVKPNFYNVYWEDKNIIRKLDNSGKKGLQKSLLLKRLSAGSSLKLAQLVRLLKIFKDKGETFLVFADFVDVAKNIEIVCQKIIHEDFYSFNMKFVSQDIKSDDRHILFNEIGNKLDGLVFAKLGSEGIDISAVDNVVIMSPSKSPTTFSQRTGRAMRPKKGKTHCNVFQFILKNTLEEKWAEYSFDEYLQAGFVQKKFIMVN